MSLRLFSLVWASWVRGEVWIGGISSGVCPIRWSRDVSLEVVVLVKTTSCFSSMVDVSVPYLSSEHLLKYLTVDNYANRTSAER